ncbi:MAG: hypothetical protein ACXADH_14875 [Candidatus Kariarchaeaceae archaeon]|jgi:hypothetical protein
MVYNNKNKRRIGFYVTQEEKEELDKLLEHGTQGKLFTAIAIGLIPLLKANRAYVLGGLLTGQLVVDLKLKPEKENKL